MDYSKEKFNKLYYTPFHNFDTHIRTKAHTYSTSTKSSSQKMD